MSTIFGILASFGLFWLILFVTCFAVVEFGQNYLYDEATPSAGLKVACGSAILAALLTWTRTEFYSMFTAEFSKTLILAVAAFGIFTLIFRFQPWHALPIGVIVVLLVSGSATMAVRSFDERNRPLPSAGQLPSKPIRSSTKINPAPVLPDSIVPAKKATEPAKK